MKGKKINGINPFEQKWGITAIEIANAEGISKISVFMRVSKYGTPFQRRAKPTKIEAKYGKTECELADEMQMHPQSITNREKLYGNVYYESQYDAHLHKTWAEVNWRELPKYQRKKKFWLMPEHPDYARARKGGWNDA